MTKQKLITVTSKTTVEEPLSIPSNATLTNVNVVLNGSGGAVWVDVFIREGSAGQTVDEQVCNGWVSKNSTSTHQRRVAKKVKHFIGTGREVRSGVRNNTGAEVTARINYSYEVNQ